MDAASLSPDEALRLFESGPTVMFKWKAAEGWPVEYVSPNVEQFGFRPDDFVSGRLPYASIVHPDDLARVAEEVRQFSEAGATHFEQEYRIMGKGGRAHWLHDFTVVRREAGGAITHYYGYIEDVTARRQAQEAAQEHWAKYRAIVDAYDGLIYICSADFKIEFMNRRLIERTGRDTTGEPCFRALHDRGAKCPWCVNDRVFQGKTVRWEVLSPKDNRWYYVVDTPIVHPDGRQSKMAMIQDITERKQAETLLRRREAVLEAIGFASEQFLKCHSLEHCLQDVLARLGQALNVNRVHVTEVRASGPDEFLAERRHEWAAAGLPPQIYYSAWRAFPMRRQGFARWIEQLSRGQTVSGDVVEFPSGEQAVLGRQQIGSLAALPYFVGGTWRGFLGFEVSGGRRTWPLVELEALKTVASLIGAAIQRQEAEHTLRRSEERHAHLLNAMPDLMLRFDPLFVLLDIKAAPDGDLPAREDAVGRSLEVVLPASAYAAFRGAADRLWKTGQRQVFDASLSDDGSRIYEVRMVPAAKGEALAILRDITARKKADVAIAKLAAFPLNNPNPLLELTESADVLFANQAARDLAAALALGRPSDILPPGYEAVCRECLASGAVRQGLLVRKGGRTILWMFMPISESRTVHAYGFTPPAGFDLRASA
ncbi:MAG TPA: PAS domain-containing protein [Kiritimatiellia bacterium]|nr:PAS domain-containing protein [Kiritimatiellia bacterium]HRZ11263.1 PAS domain-containing protein [Kiritimatiellia bacterium]HSA19114.1 PAS domain-containing protein [Kiritimatiellia bacterium]